MIYYRYFVRRFESALWEVLFLQLGFGPTPRSKLVVWSAPDAERLIGDAVSHQVAMNPSNTCVFIFTNVILLPQNLPPEGKSARILTLDHEALEISS